VGDFHLLFFASFLAHSESGQKAKYSRRADVFRCSPNNGHSTVHPSGQVEGVPLHLANAGMRPRLRDRTSRSLSQRHKLTVATLDEALSNRRGQNALALAVRLQMIAELFQFGRER
jgi:hypothetical protein